MQIAGREVSGIGLGTAQFAFRDGSRQQSIETVHAALDAGVQLIDTALAYTRPGETSYAEQLVGDAIRGWSGAAPVIATKGGHFRDGDRFPIDGRPESLRAHCSISLRALGVERIDVYQLHHVDPAVPLAESVGALEELRQQGMIAAIGLSNVSTSQIDEALAVAPIATVQNRLSPEHRGDLATVVDCESRGIAYLAYMPFGGGKELPGAAVSAIAAARQVSTQRVQLAWLRAWASNVLPLVGASRPTSILDSAELIELDHDELAAITRG
jgi:aryl-alcohol dehydrogenase-like predicted oxidoreductase